MSRTGRRQPDYRLHFGYPVICIERSGAPARRIDLEAGDPFPALEAVAEEVALARGKVTAVLPEREVWRGRAVSASAARASAAGALGVAPDRVALRLGRRGADGRRPVAAVSRATLADAHAFLARAGLGAARLTARDGAEGFAAPPDFGRFSLADIPRDAARAAAGLAATLALVAWAAPWSPPRSAEPAAVVAAAPEAAPEAAPASVAALPPAPFGFPDPTAPLRSAGAERDLVLAAPRARPVALAQSAASGSRASQSVASAPAAAPVHGGANPPEERMAAAPLVFAAPVMAARNLPTDLAPPAVLPSGSVSFARVAPPLARPAAPPAAAEPGARAPRAIGAPLARPPAAWAEPAVAPPRPRPGGAAALSTAALNARIGSALAMAAADLGPRARPNTGETKAGEIKRDELNMGAPNATPGAVRVAALIPGGAVLSGLSAGAPPSPAAVASPARRAPAPVPAAAARAQRLVATPAAAPRPALAPAPGAVRLARLDPAPQTLPPALPAKPQVQASRPTVRITPAQITPAQPRPVLRAAPQVLRAPAATPAPSRFLQPAAPTMRAATAQPARPAAQRQPASAERRVARNPAQPAREIRAAASKLALVGVFGGASGRHALVQLPNGSTERVKAGDSLGGAQVTAITAQAVHLRSRGRDSVLTLPE